MFSSNINSNEELVIYFSIFSQISLIFFRTNRGTTKGLRYHYIVKKFYRI